VNPQDSHILKKETSLDIMAIGCSRVGGEPDGKVQKRAKNVAHARSHGVKK